MGWVKKISFEIIGVQEKYCRYHLTRSFDHQWIWDLLNVINYVITYKWFDFKK